MAAVAVSAGRVLFAFEIDRVDDGFGALRGSDGTGHGLHAAAVFTVGEDDDGFAALLLLHEIGGGQINRVVECGASAVEAAAAACPP